MNASKLQRRKVKPENDSDGGSTRASNMHDLPCILSRERLTLDELFSLPPHAHLTKYVPAFNDACISVDLASDMSVVDLQALLPDVPLGHCLLMRRILSNRSHPRAFVFCCTLLGVSRCVFDYSMLQIVVICKMSAAPWSDVWSRFMPHMICAGGDSWFKARPSIAVQGYRHS